MKFIQSTSVEPVIVWPNKINTIHIPYYAMATWLITVHGLNEIEQMKTSHINKVINNDLNVSFGG